MRRFVFSVLMIAVGCVALCSCAVLVILLLFQWAPRKDETCGERKWDESMAQVTLIGSCYRGRKRAVLMLGTCTWESDLNDPQGIRCL